MSQDEMYQKFSSSPSLQMTFFVFPGGPLSLVSKIKDSKDNNSAVSGHNEIPPMLTDEMHPVKHGDVCLL